MADSVNPCVVGEVLPNDATVFRVFLNEAFRKRSSNPDKPHTVKDYAYKRSVKRLNHADGLSVGQSPETAVAGLQSENFGYCSLPVQAVHSMNEGVEVRNDPSLRGHALICHVPFIDSEDLQERQRAAKIVGILARASTVVTCDHYGPQIADQPSPS
jgi:hypothetical protein